MTNQPAFYKRENALGKVSPHIFLGAAIAFMAWIVFVFAARQKRSLFFSVLLPDLGFWLFSVLNSRLSRGLETKTGAMEPDNRSNKELPGRRLVNDEKIATIAKFASVMAHELKNPLSSLKNISYYFDKNHERCRPENKHMMEMLSSEVDRTDKMIQDFSDIAYAKRISKTLTNISGLIENIIGNSN